LGLRGLLGLQDYGGAEAEEGEEAGSFPWSDHLTIIARVFEL
jgi:hypothetical protein